MQNQGQILAPRPIKKKPVDRMNSYKNLKVMSINSPKNKENNPNPFQNYQNKACEESGNSVKTKMSKIETSKLNCFKSLPDLIQENYGLDNYYNFEKDLKNEISENDARSEIMSILSTDQNEENNSRNYSLRGSIPVVRTRASNPFIKSSSSNFPTEISTNSRYTINNCNFCNHICNCNKIRNSDDFNNVQL